MGGKELESVHFVTEEKGIIKKNVLYGPKMNAYQCLS